MLNKAFLIGRLVRDPETRMTTSGISVTKFTIAVDRTYRNENGEKTADFLRIVAWRRLAEICGQYLKKGKLVSVEGRLQIDSYEKDGQTRYAADIVADNVQMLDRGNNQTTEAILEGE